MSEIYRFFSSIDRILLREIFLTVVFVVGLFIIRAIVRKAILQSTSLTLSIKQHWLGNVRNVALTILVLGMVFIWGNELENFAVSLVAVAAAFVLATREMLLCILGSFFRTSTDMCRIGDRVEINGIKGQIIDTNLFSTVLVESTRSSANRSTVGRVITLPNSMFFGQALYNETRLGNFVALTLQIKLDRDDDWRLAEQILLESANAIIDEYAEKLAGNTRKIAYIYAVEMPLDKAQVRLTIDEVDYIGLQLQLPVPLGKSGQIEQRILRDFLSKMPLCSSRQAKSNKSKSH